MALMYENELNYILELTRRLERAYAAACRDAAVAAAVKATAAEAAWHAQRRVYRQLRQRRSSAFWS